MNANDRQVIRTALEAARRKVLHDPCYETLKEIDDALALLDKPQPESAGDARELAELLFHCDNPDLGWFTREITAFATRMRVDGQGECLSMAHNALIDMLPIDHVQKDFGEAMLARIRDVQRSLKPTGTP